MPRPWLQPPRLQRSFSALLAAWLLASVLPSPAAERFSIDPAHTYSVFEYNHWGLSLQHGRFDRNSGFIEIDMEQQTGAVNIEIESASIDTGIGFFNKILRSGDFFDAAHYPVISFKSSRLQFDGTHLVRVDGDLTIKGITKPASLDITYFDCRHMLSYGKRACSANGFSRMLRSDFDLGRHVPFVSDAVKLYVTVEAIKE